MHIPPLHTSPLSHSALDVQSPPHTSPSQTYGEQLTGAGVTHVPAELQAEATVAALVPGSQLATMHSTAASGKTQALR